MIKWDVTFYDDDTGYAYRAKAKRLTVGDAVQSDMLSEALSFREDLKGRALLVVSQVFPFVRFGIATLERAALETPPVEWRENGDPTVPDKVDWEPVEITEGVFLELPELLALRLQSEIIRKNPHRDPTYEALKKKQIVARLRSTNAPNTSANENEEKSDG